TSLPPVKEEGRPVGFAIRLPKTRLATSFASRISATRRWRPSMDHEGRFSLRSLNYEGRFPCGHLRERTIGTGITRRPVRSRASRLRCRRRTASRCALPLAVALAVDQRLDIARMGDANEAELLHVGCGLTDDVAEVEDRL